MIPLFFEKRLLFLQSPNIPEKEDIESKENQKDIESKEKSKDIESKEKPKDIESKENQKDIESKENQKDIESKENQKDIESKEKVNGLVKYFRGLLKRSIGDKKDPLTKRAGILGLNLLFPYARAIGEIAYGTYKGVELCLSDPVTSRVKGGVRNFWETGIKNNAKRIKNISYAIPHSLYTGGVAVGNSITSAGIGLGGSMAYAGQIATKPLTWIGNIPILKDVPGYKKLLNSPENIMKYIKDKSFNAARGTLDISKQYASGAWRDVDNTVGNTEGGIASIPESLTTTASGFILGEKNDTISPKISKIRQAFVEHSFIKKFIKAKDEKNAL
jgi:hypothetical protein